MKRRLASFLCLCAVAFAQEATPPETIRLDEALARAKQYAGQLQGSNLLARQAREDTNQARAARLPSASAFNQFIYTQGNGTPSGVFVANDGVHVYNEQAVVHQELFALVRHGEVDRAAAAEAVALARTEIVARGLAATVISDYYAIVAAQRKIVTARTSVTEAQRFFDLTQKQEKGGEVARADVIRSQIDLQQRQRDLAEALLTVEKAKIALGVLIFPRLSVAYSVVEDFNDDAAPPDAVAITSPDVKAAEAGVRQARFDVAVARYQWLPSFALDFYYGINANQFAAHTDYPTQATGRSTLPNYQVDGRQNLGYAAQATLNIPVWNWGATRSKIKQAEYRQEQARLDLTVAQKTLAGNSATASLEVQTARQQLASLRGSVDLAAESLRLTTLRYQAGEATALEVVDAQNTTTLSRNSYEDGLARYRVALANLRLLTGTL